MKDYSIYQYSRLVAILHIPLDALLPFAYPDNFQVTWLRLRRSLRWGTWGRQPFSGATKGGDYAKSKNIEALLTVVNRISLAKAFDNCKISVEQISTMVLRVTAARQALWTLLPRCRTELWRSVLLNNSGYFIAIHPRFQVLFCLAPVSLLLKELDGEIG